MNTVRRFMCCLVVAALVPCVAAPRAQAGIIYDTPDSLYLQNFDSLPSSTPLLTVPWANDSTLSGWNAFSGANGDTPMTAIAAYAGSGVFIASLQSLGTTAADRAFGSTTLGTVGINLATSFTNGSGGSLGSFTVTYDGEQWRRGNNSLAETLRFSYGFGDSYANVTTWENVPSLNFITPIRAPGTAAGLNGNLAANRVANINATISGLDWVSGGTLWLRWADSPDPSDDHGLAIDNFRFSATTTIVATPEPSSMLLLGVAGVGGMVLRGRKRFGAFFRGVTSSLHVK